MLKKASTGETKVVYRKMKADYYRYTAEFKADDAKKAAAESAIMAYAIASNIASGNNVLTHSIRLGLCSQFLGVPV